MLSILLSLACADHRFSAPAPVSDRCDLWAPYLPPPQPADHVATCTLRSLALQSPDDVPTVHERWSSSLSAQGLTVQHDSSRPGVVASDAPMVSEVWTDDAETLVALAISHDVVTHVSLVVVP